MASRGSPVLESIKPLQNANTNLKKRKTCHTGDDDLATSSISIRAHSASLSDEPYILNPIAILPRSRLPFSWLETTSTLSPLQSGSLFVADIPALENDLREWAEPIVLAARLAGDGGLYVIERVKRGIYSLCKLGRGLEEGNIFVAVKGWRCSGPPVRRGRCEEASIGNGADWWSAAQIEEPVVDVGSGKGRLDVTVVFGQTEHLRDVEMQDVSFADSQSWSQSAVPRLVPMERSSSGNPPASPDAELGDEKTDVQSPQELLDSLRDQYLQALYTSKTSVAYFAKGPLARCRAAFQSSEESKKPTDLINFHREAILNAKKMDLKFRETLPSTIRDIVISISDDESTKKKRKSRKKKLGKNGLYPEEGGYIRKWWKDRSLADENTSQEAETKKHIADLRLRETQLQILLILETMALELVAEEAKKAFPDSEKTETPNAKPKKSQDLNVMLELHLDRLCIWHAVSFEDTVVSDSAKNENGHLSGKKVESDAVRDFCTEVIIPFYASRLPEKCKLITRKFGVSSTISPPKQSTRKSAPRTESESRRQVPQKPRRSLQRVLTDKQTASQGRHATLSRSNTAPSKTESRCDSMEPLLPSLSGSVRGGIQKAKRAENREVDLNAVARQHETKLKKVQTIIEQKRELDAAIHALRKPNRELVAKDIADDAEKRERVGSGRKPKNPVRNPFGQGVQVMATPKGSRKKDIGLPPQMGNLMAELSKSKRDNTTASSPFGSDAVIPGSAIRIGSSTKISAANGANANAIQETPTRRPTKEISTSSVFDDPSDKGSGSSGFSGNLFRVPSRPPRPQPESMFMAMSAPSTPNSKRVGVDSSHSHLGNSNSQQHRQPMKSSVIMETPPKPGPTSMPRAGGSQSQGLAPLGSPTAVMGTPVKKGPTASVNNPVTPEKSIYEELGWDDF